MDCGIAVAATVAGVTYATAYSEAEILGRGNDGIPLSMMVKLLSRLTHDQWRRVRFQPWWRTLANSRFGNEFVVALIRHPAWLCSHYVIVKGEKIYDPEIADPMSQSDYPRGQWTVVAVIRRG